MNEYVQNAVQITRFTVHLQQARTTDHRSCDATTETLPPNGKGIRIQSRRKLYLGFV